MHDKLRWKSEIPSKWKINYISGYLHRAKLISSEFDNDVETTETTILNAGYTQAFVFVSLLPTVFGK